MKKKIILVILLVVVTFLFCGCSNRKIGVDFEQKFTRAYIRTGNDWTEIKIKNWRDFDDGDEVQVTDSNGLVYLTHYSNIVMLSK